MVLRLVFSAGVLCGLSAASDQPLRALNTSTARSMQACTQLALQNAVNPARQKKLMQDNIMAGGINYSYVLGSDRPKHGIKVVAKAKSEITRAVLSRSLRNKFPPRRDSNCGSFLPI